MAAIILVSSWPARPTKGSPCRSSSSPGASPTNMMRASGLPTPKTTCVRRAARCGHFWQTARARRDARAARPWSSRRRRWFPRGAGHDGVYRRNGVGIFGRWHARGSEAAPRRNVTAGGLPAALRLGDRRLRVARAAPPDQSPAPRAPRHSATPRGRLRARAGSARRSAARRAFPSYLPEAGPGAEFRRRRRRRSNS